MVSRSSLPPADVVLRLERNSLLGQVLANGLRALDANPRISDADLRSTLEGSGRQSAHKL